MFLFYPLQGSAKVGASGLVNFITAVAHHLCPSLSVAFTQPGALTLAGHLCRTQLRVQATEELNPSSCLFLHPFRPCSEINANLPLSISPMITVFNKL